MKINLLSQELEQQHLVEYKLKKDQDMLVLGAQLVPSWCPVQSVLMCQICCTAKARSGHDGKGALIVSKHVNHQPSCGKHLRCWYIVFRRWLWTYAQDEWQTKGTHPVTDPQDRERIIIEQREAGVRNWASLHAFGVVYNGNQKWQAKRNLPEYDLKSWAFPVELIVNGLVLAQFDPTWPLRNSQGSV